MDAEGDIVMRGKAPEWSEALEKHARAVAVQRAAGNDRALQAAVENLVVHQGIVAVGCAPAGAHPILAARIPMGQMLGRCWMPHDGALDVVQGLLIAAQDGDAAGIARIVNLRSAFDACPASAEAWSDRDRALFASWVAPWVGGADLPAYAAMVRGFTFGIGFDFVDHWHATGIAVMNMARTMAAVFRFLAAATHGGPRVSQATARRCHAGDFTRATVDFAAETVSQYAARYLGDVGARFDPAARCAAVADGFAADRQPSDLEVLLIATAAQCIAKQISRVNFLPIVHMLLGIVADIRELSVVAAAAFSEVYGESLTRTWSCMSAIIAEYDASHAKPLIDDSARPAQSAGNSAWLVESLSAIFSNAAIGTDVFDTQYPHINCTTMLAFKMPFQHAGERAMQMDIDMDSAAQCSVPKICQVLDRIVDSPQFAAVSDCGDRFLIAFGMPTGIEHRERVDRMLKPVVRMFTSECIGGSVTGNI